MKHIRPVVKVTNNRPKRRPMVFVVVGFDCVNSANFADTGYNAPIRRWRTGQNRQPSNALSQTSFVITANATLPRSEADTLAVHSALVFCCRSTYEQPLRSCCGVWHAGASSPEKTVGEQLWRDRHPYVPYLPLQSRPYLNFGPENVVVPIQKARNGTNRFCTYSYECTSLRPFTPENVILVRSGGSDDKSPDKRRTNQAERYKGHGNARASSLSGWDDGLVTLSFSNRLKLHQNKMTTRGARSPPEAEPRKQQSKQAQRPQMQGRLRGQKEQSDAPPRERRSQHHRADAAKSAAAEHESGASSKLKAPLMTRPSSSTFNLHAQPTTKTTPMASRAPKAKVLASNATKANRASSSTDVAAQQTVTTALSSAGRSARLTGLSSTNLSALFRTRDALGTGVPQPLPAHTSTTARVRSVLERSAGDYSRFLPRHVGVRKSASPLPALRTARHALAVQRDLSLEQRRVALHIIEGLTQPHQSQVRT